MTTDGLVAVIFVLALAAPAAHVIAFYFERFMWTGRWTKRKED